jgi:hypothetical protein
MLQRPANASARIIAIPIGFSGIIQRAAGIVALFNLSISQLYS